MDLADAAPGHRDELLKMAERWLELGIEAALYESRRAPATAPQRLSLH